MLRGLLLTVASVGVILCFGLLPTQAETQNARSNVMFVLDASGSMKKKIESGETRFLAARNAMMTVLDKIGDSARIGLLVFGHRRAKDCGDIELVYPIGAVNMPTVFWRVGPEGGFEPRGETPIATSLLHALNSFSEFRGQSNRIVIVTDGIEECGGDPCDVARAAASAGVGVTVDVVGFTLDENQRRTVQCIADSTGGKYYSAQNAQELGLALKAVGQQIVAEPPAPEATRLNLLSPKNGGQILAAPSDVWQASADDKEDYVSWTNQGEEAVYSFREDRPATFDMFTVFIGKQDSGNLKEFELSVGDEGPTGAFRSIGTFTTHNTKLFRTPHQEFKFGPVTARYLKVKVISNYGGGNGVYATEFQLFGELGEAGAAPTPTPAPQPVQARINLLSPKNGSEILAVPSDVWLASADEKEDYVTWTRPGEEAVYGFREGRPATFDMFTVYIGKQDIGNLKEFELLAGDDGPMGPFRSVGTFAAQNVKLLKTPYQEFKFAPVTARYLKVKVLSNHGGGNDVYATEFQLFGELGEAGLAPTPTPAPLPVQARINLLSQENGGDILTAPSVVWLASVDGSEDYAYWTNANEEAVYGFKDERTAIFDVFTVFIGKQDDGNLNEFELLAGDASPTGTFRSIGTFATQNVRLLKTPYQEFKFAPVTARYLKVRVISNHAGGTSAFATEFQLFGEFTE